VSRLVWDAFLPTLSLVVASMLVGILVAVPSGIIAAMRKDRRVVDIKPLLGRVAWGAARDRPFVLRHGQTVEDVARLVHKDLARSLKYARVWGKSGFDGQHVGREHPLADGDVVEVHA